MAKDTMSFLAEFFGEYMCKWPPHSLHLSPLDFFLWSYLKNIVYKDACHSTAELKKTLRMQLGKSTPCVEQFSKLAEKAFFVCSK